MLYQVNKYQIELFKKSNFKNLKINNDLFGYGPLKSHICMLGSKSEGQAYLQVPQVSELPV